MPGDVSLIGFDNWDLSGYSDMHLTTVERNMGDIAREGARVLLRRLDDGIVDNRRIYLDNKLIIRGYGTEPEGRIVREPIADQTKGEGRHEKTGRICKKHS